MHPHHDSDLRRPALDPGPGRGRLPPLRVLLWRARLAVTALLLGLACAVVVGELRPPPAQTSPVPVASHALTAGHVLVASDLQLAEMPSGLVPSGAPTAAEPLVGATLAVAVPAGLPIVDGLLARSLAGPEGTVVAAVRLADPAVAALLATGARVDILAATDDGATGRLLVRGALVLAPPEGTGREAGDGSPPVLLAVTPAEAADLAGAGPSALLTAVIVE